MIRKLTHTSVEIARRSAKLDEMSNARRSIKGYPIAELGVIPKRTVRPNSLKVTA